MRSFLILVVLAALATHGGCTGSGRRYHMDRSASVPPSTCDRESYNPIEENPRLSVERHPLSTFSIDVDTASYSNIRRFLNEGRLPPADAVRIEEMINYFTYRYPQPDDNSPFSATMEVADCPWENGNKLVHIGIQGRRIDEDRRHPRNLVFLIDVSGSMSSSDKLPLVKECLRLLVKDLDEEDTISIVVYAGKAGMVLSPTSGERRKTILEAVDRLEAGGSTNGGDGILLAYRTAEENFISDGVNRVILCTDGDFNVGVTNQEELIRLIEKKRKTGVYLSLFGFGTGNLQDGTMEQLADHGNGNYAYIDSIDEARRVFVHKLGSILIPIANDVKIQVEFNPDLVASYRLIGYENRILRDKDFKNDAKDAGDIGAGHTVTALYEITPVRSGRRRAADIDEPLKYRHRNDSVDDELMTVKIRYKPVNNPGDTRDRASKLLTFPVMDDTRSFDEASSNLRFSSAVAAFGMLLRDSSHANGLTYKDVVAMADDALDIDPRGARFAEASARQERREFIDLVEKARRLSD